MDQAETLTLGDGRRIGFAVFGIPLANARQGRIVIALHGTPGSRLKYRPADDAARARGLTLIALDRWGYGLSDPHPAPSLAAFAQDLGEIADRLAIDRFSVCGISGGGPFAAAAASALRERVVRAALVAPVGPIMPDPVAGLATPAKLDAYHRFVFRTLARAPSAVWLVFRVYRRCLQFAPRFAIFLAMMRNGPADKALLERPDVVMGLASMMRAGLDPQGVGGPVTDLSLFGRPWGLQFGARAQSGGGADVRIWFGDQDLTVPEDAILRLADVIDGASLDRVPGQGHFWVSTRFDLVLDWLAGGGTRRGAASTADEELARRAAQRQQL